MKIAVEGVVTSIEVKTKGDKPVTELLLAQQGEREQVKVRLEGNRSDDFSLYEVANFVGRLLIWKQRDSVGTMVLA